MVWATGTMTLKLAGALLGPAPILPSHHSESRDPEEARKRRGTAQTLSPSQHSRWYQRPALARFRVFSAVWVLSTHFHRVRLGRLTAQPEPSRGTAEALARSAGEATRPHAERRQEEEGQGTASETHAIEDTMRTHWNRLGPRCREIQLPVVLEPHYTF